MAAKVEPTLVIFQTSSYPSGNIDYDLFEILLKLTESSSIKAEEISKAKSLLTQGADPFILQYKDEKKISSFQLAAMLSDTEILECILTVQNGKWKDAYPQIKWIGNPPIQTAIMHGNINAINCFHRHILSQEIWNGKDQNLTPLRATISYERLYQEKKLAYVSNSISPVIILKLLLSFGVDPSFKFNKGYVAFNYALDLPDNFEGNKAEIIELLLPFFLEDARAYQYFTNLEVLARRSPKPLEADLWDRFIKMEEESTKIADRMDLDNLDIPKGNSYLRGVFNYHGKKTTLLQIAIERKKLPHILTLLKSQFGHLAIDEDHTKMLEDFLLTLLPNELYSFFCLLSEQESAFLENFIIKSNNLVLNEKLEEFPQHSWQAKLVQEIKGEHPGKFPNKVVTSSAPKLSKPYETPKAPSVSTFESQNSYLVPLVIGILIAILILIFLFFID